jgi:hypothetical protein
MSLWQAHAASPVGFGRQALTFRIERESKRIGIAGLQRNGMFLCAIGLRSKTTPLR